MYNNEVICKAIYKAIGEVNKQLDLSINNETIDEIIDIANKCIKFNDKELADCVDACTSNKLIYLQERKVWAEYTGIRWQDCNDVRVYYNLLLPLISNIINAYFDDEPPRGTKLENQREESRRNQIRGKLANFGATSTYRNVLYMHEIPAGISVSELDGRYSDYLLNIPSGTIMLEQDGSYTLRPHTHTDYITKVMNADIMANAGDLWVKFITRTIPNEQTRKFFQMYCGYLLTGKSNEQMLVILFGKGSTGKSVCVEALHYLLGDYATTIPIESLLANRNDGGTTATPELAKTKGKRLVTTSEAGQNRVFRADLIKLLTGGETVTARYLHGNPFEFDPTHKILMSTNHMPCVPSSVDSGLARRLCIIPFEQVLKPEERDTGLLEKLQRPEEMAGLLQWCLEGYKMYKESKLALMAQLPPEVAKMVKGYIEASDTLGQFIKDECVVGDGEKGNVKQMLEAYTEHAGIRIKRSTFVREMEERGYKQLRNEKGMYFKGISVMNNIM